MTFLDELYGSKFLKADDLPEGKDVIETVRTVADERVGKDQDRKGVVYFEGHTKGLILNKTNFVAIRDALGKDHKDWPGKNVILYRTWVDMQGKSVPAIRVRRAPAETPAAPSGEAPDDVVPF